MIKRYLQFIKENQFSGFNSLGEWIETLMDDDYVRNIVSRYTGDIDPSIQISNAINILDNKVQDEIKEQIDSYLQNGIEDKEPEIITSTETDDLMESMVQGEISVAGKGIFSSFLKSLTALGQKESNPNWDKCPEDFLIYYHFDLNSQDLKAVFSRFKSLIRYENYIDYGKNEISLYFGIKCNGQFEYGIAYDILNPIGQFKLSKSTINWILKLESKSAQSLKKELVNLSYSDIITLGTIKMDMKNFNPGYHEKRSYPTISDKVISFGYYGFGNWNMGKLNDVDLQTIKSNFSNFVISKKWGSKVLISVNPQSFWLWIHLKLK
jgi:hypothetical protein